MTELKQIPKILIVDDKPQNLFALEKLLSKLEVEIVQATSGFDALKLTLKHEFCLAIVDVQMPEMDGYELVELLRGNKNTQTLPVIFVSAIYSDEYHHRKGYDAGAVDFLSKPFVPEILLSKVSVFMALYHQKIELQDLVSQLNRANADKDKLFSIISHDLRSPFQVLLGNVEWMLEQMENLSKTDIREMAESIFRSAQSARDLLENLLAWSRLQRRQIEYEPGPVELSELARNTTALLNEMALNKDIRLEQGIEAGLYARIDRHMIDSVIRNLTANALKFTPTKGQVTISAHRTEVAPDNNAAGEWVEVAVTDSGVGISPEDIDKLFRIDVHHTTPGTAQEMGTGLGLILCQEMVEKNGGRIWVESDGVPGQGTTVKFTVPLAEGPGGGESKSE